MIQSITIHLLEVAIIDGKTLMFNILIGNQYINIKTIDPILGNTTLHLALKISMGIWQKN